MSKVAKTRTMPVIIAIIGLIATVLALVTPFMYSSLDNKSILGFCLIFGGKYVFHKGGTTVNISTSWWLVAAVVVTFIASLYSLLVCRKTNKANSIITFLFLVFTSILFFLANRFCMEGISSNVGYQNSVTLSWGPATVGVICLLDACLALFDVIKKRAR